MNLRNVFLALFSVSLFVVSCKKETEPDLEDHTLYAPVDLGRQYEYEVDSSFWTTDSSGVVSFRYRETYETDVPDNTGGLQTRIKMERDGGNLGGYQLSGYAYIQKYYNKTAKQYTVERTQNNEKFILLVSPLKAEDSLNRNAKNLLTPEYWTATMIEHSYSVTAGSFPHCLTLAQTEYTDSIYSISSKEIYAHNVGLIYKEDIYLKGKTDVPNWENVPIEQRIESGYKYVKTLKSHVDLY